MDTNLNVITGYVTELRQALNHATTENVLYARTLVDNLDHDLDKLYAMIRVAVEQMEETIKP